MIRHFHRATARATSERLSCARNPARFPRRHSSTSKSPPERPHDNARHPGIFDYLLPSPAVIVRSAFNGLFLLLGAHVFTHYFYSVTACEGISMLPSFNSFGDWIIVSKYYRRGRGVQVGDVVSFQHPVEEGRGALKRVLGMPGDFVCRDTPGVGEKVIQVPQGHCWVVGDNLAHSRDSRLFGPLPLALIRGKVIQRMPTSPHWTWPEAVETTLYPMTEEDLD